MQNTEQNPVNSEDSEDSPSGGDKNHWLDPETPIITPERRAKGDLYTEGEKIGEKRVKNPQALEDIIYARSFMCTILRFLWMEKYIDDQMWVDGNTFGIWQTLCGANFGKLAAQSYRQVKSAMDSSGLNEYGYVLLVKRMPPHQMKQIDYAVNTHATPHLELVAERNRYHYQHAFTRLVTEMHGIRDHLKAISEMDPADREQMAEDNLKKLLVDLKISDNNKNTVRHQCAQNFPDE